jgi:hypothetical protein
MTNPRADEPSADELCLCGDEGIRGAATVGKRRGEEAPPWVGQPIGEEEEERRRMIGGLVLFPDLGFHPVRKKGHANDRDGSLCLSGPLASDPICH